ncbi:MAG: hypothetical protein ACRCV7_03225 [Culicoidibacterales bacterium]
MLEENEQHPHFEQINTDEIKAENPQSLQIEPEIEKSPKSLKGMSKRFKILLVSLVSILVIVVFAYGFNIYSKVTKLNDLYHEKTNIESKYNEIKKIIDKDSDLVELQEYAKCYQSNPKIQGGKAFSVYPGGKFFLVQKISQDDIKKELQHCKLQASQLEGAEALIESVANDIIEKNNKNTELVSQVNSANDEWRNFIDAFDKSGGGTLSVETYDNLRILAAKAMGVSPSTIGNEMDSGEIRDKVRDRLKGIENKQVTISDEKIKQFIEKNIDGKTMDDIQNQLKEKEKEAKQLEDEIHDLDSHIQTKKSEVMNPFK